VDEQLGGLKPGELIIVGARPSMGKTSFALHALDFLAFQKKWVLMFSLEMGRQSITDRLVCQIAGIDSQKFHNASVMNDQEIKAINKAFARMKMSTFLIEDTNPRNMTQIAALSRRVKRRPGLDLIIVDYIGLVDASGNNRSRQEEIAFISRQLKALARHLHVPVVALSQLNRAVENRDDKRPKLADLRDSGAIEQDADQVLFLHRPEYYDANDRAGLAEVIVAKNRNGPTGAVSVLFEKHSTRFSNLSSHPDGSKPY
jgi:replicative DNA helicase